MSKQRAQQRAAREAEAARRRAETEAQRRASAARRNRAERRRLLWSRVRLWQHGPQFRARRERWGVLATVVLLVLLVVYLWTGSVSALAGTALICVIVTPVLAAFVFHDRSSR